MSLFLQQDEETVSLGNKASNYVSGNDVMTNNSLHADKKKFLIGLAIVFLIAATWVGSAQFGKETYTSHFNAPYFTIWFSTNWMMFSYPVCLPVFVMMYRKDLKSMWRLAK